MTTFANNLAPAFPHAIGIVGSAEFFRPDVGYSFEAEKVIETIFRANLRLITPSSGMALTKISPMPYVPKTVLGKKLMELRNAAIAKGMSLMTAEEISKEIARRRGEIE